MKLLFPITARPHFARQKLLLKELKKLGKVDIWQPKVKSKSMATNAILYSIELNNYLQGKSYDGVIIRGDRYEMLGIAMTCAYLGIKIIHIEGGDESGVIDNKVRHAISHLADFHFCTNKESHQRLVNMGIPIDKIWNYGSLDVEFAYKVKPKRLKKGLYIFVAYHGIVGENVKELEKALAYFKCDIIKIGGNTDYNKKYGDEEFSPEDYINLMRNAKVLVGNSSSLLKEASITGKGVVLIGDRQNKRLTPHNVIRVPCKADNILKAILFQMQVKYKPDYIYYQPNTSVKIARKIKEILWTK